MCNFKFISERKYKDGQNFNKAFAKETSALLALAFFLYLNQSIYLGNLFGIQGNLTHFKLCPDTSQNDTERM